ncbi:MAG: hypothetical protein K0R39_4149 [Symbiobacteriaceae bacterium]|nr:hypothetical protein [Symbiobacteriaceae bacterium]
MLKCPTCGRSGGPFRLGQQIQADNQVLRGWSCPCGSHFHAAAGAERTVSSQAPYTGFVTEWNGKTQPVRLQSIGKHETVWSLGNWSLRVAGPPSGPGTRFVSLLDTDEETLAEWKLEPGWGPQEVLRRTKARAMPEGMDADLLARVIVRILA